MKKNVLSLIALCCLAFAGVAQAQEVTLTVNQNLNATIQETRDPVAISYASSPNDALGFASIGMAFDWGYMFPADMMAEFAGKYVTQLAYIDGGDASVVGDYEAHVWIGGDDMPSRLAASQPFHITGEAYSVQYLLFDEPVLITGADNVWVTIYNDGSVQSACCIMPDMGAPNSRWIGVTDYNMWMDLAEAQGGSGYSFVLFAVVDDYDIIGENQADLSVYPNPTTSSVTIQAQGMNRITVLNTLGQVVYNAPATGDLQVLDLGQYNAGVYMVRVETENGVSVKQVSVVK